MFDVSASAGTTVPVNDTALSNDAASVSTESAQTGVDNGSSIDSELSAVWSKHNPVRGEGGKFAAKDEGAAAAASGTDPAVAGATPPADDTSSADPSANASQEPAKPAIDAPHSWSAEEKARWASVPLETQAYIAKRETEAQQAISRAGNQAKDFETKLKAYEPLDQLIAANKDHFTRNGVKPEQSFAFLLDAQRNLEANPMQGLVQIGLSYGIDLRPAFQGQQIQQHAPDPRVAQLEQQVRDLSANVTSTQSKMTEKEQAEAQVQNAQLQKTVDDFKADKPHWGEVEGDVAAWIPILRERNPDKAPADILKEAYDKAVWANPSVRTSIQTDQQVAAEEKRRTEAAKKATDARKSASVNVKSSPSGSSPKTLDDELAEIGRRHYSS